MNMKKNPKYYQGGQAIITAVVFFLLISIVVMMAITTPIAGQIRSASEFILSKKSYVAAEAINEDALYRLNRGKTLPSTLTLPFTDMVVNAVITNTGDAIEIIATGDFASLTRVIRTVFSKGVGVSFNYALQTGNGGVSMAGGSGIYGNMYSNGDITGSGGVFVTGTAIAANISSPLADQSNTGSTTPPYSITFGNVSATQDFAQSFKTSTTTTVTEASFYIKKNGTPANATVKVMTDNAGKPSTTALASATLNASTVTTLYGWNTVAFSTNPTLTASTTYWLVVDASNGNTNTYTIGATNNTYANGLVKLGSGSTWNNLAPTSTLDSYFNLYLGGDTGLINGITIGTGGVGNALAHTVTNSSIAGTLYCQVGSGNNKSCNTSLADPSPQAMPVSDANIQTWKDEASAGTVRNSSWTIGGSTATSTGPSKIIGNLTVNGGGVLTITGTVYVTGNVTVEGGGKIKLASGYGSNSAVIVSDGVVKLQGGGAIEGSGNSNSYVLLLTTSSCPSGAGCGGDDAIEAGGGSGSVILNAQNGTINFSGGTAAKSAVGKRMVMTGGATITYDTGLTDVNFVSGPAGSWGVDSWKEVAQ